MTARSLDISHLIISCRATAIVILVLAPCLSGGFGQDVHFDVDGNGKDPRVVRCSSLLVNPASLKAHRRIACR